MKPCARNASTLAALLLLPLLQALCPRLAPDVISGKVIPCRYLCIKINFFELPSIILGTEKDGVLCSTLLLRRRGVCKNGGCIPFGTEEEIKPKGTFGKVILAIDKFASGSFRKTAPEPGTPFGPIVTTATSMIRGGSGSTAEGTSQTASNPIASAAAGVLAKKVSATLKGVFSSTRSGGSKSESPEPGSSSSNPDKQSNQNEASSSRTVALDFGGSPPTEPLPASNTPDQRSNGNAATSDSRTVILPSSGGPPIVPSATEGGENSDSPVSETPRGASPAGATRERRPFSSIFERVLNKPRSHSADNGGETLGTGSASESPNSRAQEHARQGNGGAVTSALGSSQNSRADRYSSSDSTNTGGDTGDGATPAASSASDGDSSGGTSTGNGPSGRTQPNSNGPSARSSPSGSFDDAASSGSASNRQGFETEESERWSAGESDKSSTEPPKRTSPSFIGSIASSATGGARSATRRIFSRFRRSYTV